MSLSSMASINSYSLFLFSSSIFSLTILSCSLFFSSILLFFSSFSNFAFCFASSFAFSLLSSIIFCSSSSVSSPPFPRAPPSFPLFFLEALTLLPSFSSPSPVSCFNCERVALRCMLLVFKDSILLLCSSCDLSNISSYICLCSFSFSAADLYFSICDWVTFSSFLIFFSASLASLYCSNRSASTLSKVLCDIFSLYFSMLSLAILVWNWTSSIFFLFSSRIWYLLYSITSFMSSFSSRFLETFFFFEFLMLSIIISWSNFLLRRIRSVDMYPFWYFLFVIRSWRILSLSSSSFFISISSLCWNRCSRVPILWLRIRIFWFFFFWSFFNPTCLLARPLKLSSNSERFFFRYWSLINDWLVLFRIKLVSSQASSATLCTFSILLLSATSARGSAASFSLL